VLRSEQAPCHPLLATMHTEVHKELPAAGATTLPTFCDPAVSCTAARRAGRAHAVCSVRVRCESNYEELTRSHFTRHSPPLQFPVLVQSIGHPVIPSEARNPSWVPSDCAPPTRLQHST
jgi:hypothetical protein